MSIDVVLVTHKVCTGHVGWFGGTAITKLVALGKHMGNGQLVGRIVYVTV